MNNESSSLRCCFCFLLHHGFINVVYLDTARLFWGLVFGLIILTGESMKPYEGALIGTNLALIVIQAAVAFQSVRFGIPVNDYRYYLRYLICKILFVLSNIGAYIIIPYFEDYSNKNLNLVLATIWCAIETYMAVVVLRFYIATRNGVYGPLGVPPLFAIDISRVPLAITVTSKGFKYTPPSSFMAVELAYPVRDENHHDPNYTKHPVALDVSHISIRGSNILLNQRRSSLKKDICHIEDVAGIGEISTRESVSSPTALQRTASMIRRLRLY
eukprot:TRINITY_DN23303_c0_g1_i1.p1 TRINITY_DN23303_c0_g1~~TRINITY_DN23303_c0_g1_i1.p1  ORF type:complete len:272 (-),score=33.73 TRINITY_DN23303_c0_g1_i1:70-885(-)